jgi:predicted glycosyltransferase involved in capsule biosynthesis
LKSNFKISFIIPYTNRDFLTNDNRLFNLLESLVNVPFCEVVIDIQGDIDNALADLATYHANLVLVNNKLTGNQAYSPGQARNRALKKASGDYLFFIDADLLCPPELLNNLLKRSQHLAEIGKQAFEMFPCFYLTEQETKAENIGFDKYLTSYLAGQIDLVENIALASSCLLVNREWVIELGGFDADFIGHGGEDLELIHRLCLHYPILALPADYAENIKAQHPADYKGCRRYYCLYALNHLFEGRFLLHLWHPRPLTNLYHQSRAGNDRLLCEKLSVQQPRFAVIAQSKIGQLQQQSYLSEALIADLENKFSQWLKELQDKFSYPLQDFPGLFNWHNSVVIKRPLWRKVRKLYLHPKLFFKDSGLFKK